MVNKVKQFIYLVLVDIINREVIMKRRCLLKTLALVIVFLFVAVEIPSMVGVTNKETVFTSIVSDGYIQDLIDNASDGDTIYISGGIYYENVIINKSISLVGEDKNTTIIDGSENGYVIYVTADWVNISGFSIQNSGYDNWNYAGISLYSYYNNITGNIILNNSHGISGDLNHCIITNNIIANNNEYGLEFYGNNNSISGNTITKNEVGIDLFSVENNNIFCNTIKNNGLGISLADMSNHNHIINNTITNNYDAGIQLAQYCNHNDIINNNISNNYDIGIFLWGLFGSNDYNNIFNNTIISNSGAGMELVGYSTNISGNTITNNNRDGIRLFESNNNNICKNIITNNNGVGIWVCDSNNAVIDNNTITNNDCGVNINNANRNTITENTIGNNNYDGLYIDVYSDYNNIINNNISNNNYYGIKIDIYSDCNNIVNNTISNNNYSGIDIKSYTFNNSIYHNNFINNTINALDYGNNIWYNTTVLEGNHWGDYNGTDENNDGIGDKPYNISEGSNQDLYPLMHPFENYSILQIIIPNIPFFEDDDVPIFVFSLANLPIKDAVVQFNNQTSLTDSNGTIWLTAPQVQMDKYYEIKATKAGYTSANEKILIRNMPSNFKYGFIFGKIVNLTGTNKVIVFEAFNVTVVTFRPFMISQYTSGKEFIISYNYEGWIGYLFVFAFCKILI